MSETEEQQAAPDEPIEELVEETPQEETPEGGSLADSLLNDLKRVSAEYANYRKRVERDREITIDFAVDGTIRDLLPILDDIDRARAAEDVVEGSAVAIIFQKLEEVIRDRGVEKFGVPGDEFDPKLHEALTQVPTEGVTEPILLDVILPGYLRGERLIRAARVVVAVEKQ
ncbi:MAG: nucleotide exchange factor GrpE [Microbacteriaceae bacterium]|nr:nucleotide exchange factor GrpE [Microbacteriaceae bacterium]